MNDFEYDCPECGADLYGGFGDDVHCKECDICYETDWDYSSYDSMSAWIVKRKECTGDCEDE